MKNYSIHRISDNNRVLLETFHNKAAAIQLARECALEEQRTMIVVNEDKDLTIAICEFPFYLRGLKLDIRDILVTKI